MKTPRLASILVLFATAREAEAALEFSGYLKSEKEIRFVVTDLENGKKSQWLTLGDTFQGFTVSDFDQRAEVLSLKSGSGIVRLTLKLAGTSDGKPGGSFLFKFGIIEGGKLTLNGRPVTFDELDFMIQNLPKRGISQITLSFPRTTPANSFRTVMESVKKAGIVKIEFKTDGEEAP